MIVMTLLLAAATAATEITAPAFPRDRILVGAYCLAPEYAQDERHIREFKECGLDYLTHAAKDAEADGLCARYGVLTMDSWWELQRPGKAVSRTRAAAAIQMYDEPPARLFDWLRENVCACRKTYPGLQVYINLYPIYAFSYLNDSAKTLQELGASSYEEYVDLYCRRLPLDYISWDHYFYARRNISQYYDNFRIVGEACRRTGRSLWFVPQVNSSRPQEWTGLNRLRFQTNVALAFGAENFAWACYSYGWWTNQVIDCRGEKTVQYDRLRQMNAELKAFSSEYWRFRNVNTHFVGFEKHLDELKDLPVKSPNALDVGYVRDLRAEDGEPLLVGEMAPRGGTHSCARALFVAAVEDPFEKSPRKRTVSFRLAKGRSVRVVGANGEVGLRSGAEDGCFSFEIRSNEAALIVSDGKRSAGSCDRNRLFVGDVGSADGLPRVVASDDVSDFTARVSRFCRTEPLDCLVFGQRPHDKPFALDSLRVAAEACRRSGRSLWVIPETKTPEGAADVAELRTQTYAALAFGAEAILWDGCSPETDQVTAELGLVSADYWKFRTVTTHRIGDAEKDKDVGTGYVRRLCSEDGGLLIIGEMVPRDEPRTQERALFVFAPGDPRATKPTMHKITFSLTEGYSVRIAGQAKATRPERYTKGCTEKASEVYAFEMASNEAVLLIFAP